MFMQKERVKCWRKSLKLTAVVDTVNTCYGLGIIICPVVFNYAYRMTMSRGSSVSIVSDYGRGSIPDRRRGFFL
jgi:hypothetical protein